MSQTPESKLEYLDFQLLQPSPLLKPFIRHYWYFQSRSLLHIYREEYMNPRGSYGIVFNFGDAVRLGGQMITDPVFLDGANTISRSMGFFGNVDMLGIRFHEGTALPFLGIPLMELRNEINLLDALDGPSLLRFHAQLQETVSLPARARLLDNWLLSHLRSSREQSLLVPASLNLLRKSNGRFPIAELAREFAVSQRQLERIYLAQVGMSPKQYTQLLRVDSARLALRQLNRKPTAEIATELGFYDQSHFIREFSAVIGISPHAYIKLARSTAGITELLSFKE